MGFLESNFPELIRRLHEELSGAGLPGKSAWLEMSSRVSEEEFLIPENSRYRDAAVTILLIPDYRQDSPVIPFIKKTEDNSPHSRQIALPGGACKEEDRNFEETALRELEEETGISRDNVKILGKLTSLYIPVSGYLVHPFVGFVETMPVFHIDKREVEALYLVPLDTFLDPGNKQIQRIKVKDSEIAIPVFRIEDQILWGATAMIMNEFLAIYRRLL